MEGLAYPFDGAWILKHRKSIRRQLLADGRPRISKRIAVLGGSTTNDIVSVLELFLLDNGIEPTFYQSEYAQYWQDAMFGNPELHSFAPDIVFIHTSLRNIQVPFPKMTDTEEAVNAALTQQYQHFETMWKKLAETYHCPIIQNNFELPFYRLLGNRDASDYRGRTRFVTRLNEQFYTYAQTHRSFYIHDINFLSASYGLAAWSDPSYWYLYKYALCVPAIPEFSYNLCNIIKSIFGKNKKALALDLDNTLWGGIVGDDGVNGIEIGQETPQGQAYWEFQNYLKAQKDLGILLTVCSKNDEENAIAGLNHPDAPLKPADFTVIKANWENKAQNIAQTAQELQILPESIVFVDDNPAERAIVRDFLKSTAVPEVGSVETYIPILDRSGFFEVTTFSEEDLKRGEMYEANLARAQAEQQFADYNDYLKSLQMTAIIRDFEPMYLPRITQLTNKSNQFNLTTRRYNTEEMQQVFEDPNAVRLYGKLLDKFGDNGIVSVVIGHKESDVLHLDLWLMSCRVLKRDMEFAMMDQLAEICKQQGIQTIRGYYYPTAKNNMVRELYRDFGFTLVAEDADKNTIWELAVSDYTKKNFVITVKTEE